MEVEQKPKFKAKTTLFVTVRNFMVFLLYQTFSGHHGSVEDVIEIDGVLISAGADRTIKLWQNLDQGDSKNDDDLSAKKRAKREERGQVRTTGKFLIEEFIQDLT